MLTIIKAIKLQYYVEVLGRHVFLVVQKVISHEKMQHKHSK